MDHGPELLRVAGLYAGYGRVGVLEDVSLQVPEGGFVAIVGSNGAGKTTLLRAISGMLPVRAGHIHFDGAEITGQPATRTVGKGLRHVAEGRRLFRSLSVADNLDLALYSLRLGGSERNARKTEAFDLFPVLGRKRGDAAGRLSGGEQQMLVVAQALVSHPKMVMLDEPSLGLAPIVIDEVFESLVGLRSAGRTVLLVEQMVERALELADYAYVMQLGSIVGHGKADTLLHSGIVQQAYLGGWGPQTQTGEEEK